MAKAVKRKSFAKEFEDTDRWTKFYRSGMAMAVTCMIALGGYFGSRTLSMLDDVSGRVGSLERKQDKFEYIVQDYAKKFDDLQRELRRMAPK